MKRTTLPKTLLCLALLLGWTGGARSAAAQSASWSYVAISAPQQTVEVRTPRGSYNAVLENTALVYPSGRASGTLFIGRDDGFLQMVELHAGHVQFGDGTVSSVLLRARAVDTESKLGGDIAIILRPTTQRSVDYDLLWHEPPARFEAQANITVFPN